MWLVVVWSVVVFGAPFTNDFVVGPTVVHKGDVVSVEVSGTIRPGVGHTIFTEPGWAREASGDHIQVAVAGISNGINHIVLAERLPNGTAALMLGVLNADTLQWSPLVHVFPQEGLDSMVRVSPQTTGSTYSVIGTGAGRVSHATVTVATGDVVFSKPYVYEPEVTIDTLARQIDEEGGFVLGWYSGGTNEIHLMTAVGRYDTSKDTFVFSNNIQQPNSMYHSLQVINSTTVAVVFTKSKSEGGGKAGPSLLAVRLLRYDRTDNTLTIVSEGTMENDRSPNDFYDCTLVASEPVPRFVVMYADAAEHDALQVVLVSLDTPHPGGIHFGSPLEIRPPGALKPYSSFMKVTASHLGGSTTRTTVLASWSDQLHGGAFGTVAIDVVEDQLVVTGPILWNFEGASGTQDVFEFDAATVSDGRVLTCVYTRDPVAQKTYANVTLAVVRGPRLGVALSEGTKGERVPVALAGEMYAASAWGSLRLNPHAEYYGDGEGKLVEGKPDADGLVHLPGKAGVLAGWRGLVGTALNTNDLQIGQQDMGTVPPSPPPPPPPPSSKSKAWVAILLESLVIVGLLAFIVYQWRTAPRRRFLTLGEGAL